MILRHVSDQCLAVQSAFKEYSGRAAADSGVSKPRQVLEMVSLRLGSGKLMPDDYYRMRVYRKELTYTEKRRFLSQGALQLLGRSGWLMVAHDKLIAQALLEREGVRTARIHAICNLLRSYGTCPALRTAAAIREYLQSDDVYPFVAKPVTGMFSYDVSVVRKLDRETGMLHMAGGRTVDVGEFAEQAIRRPNGTLFQEALRPHPQIVEHVSPHICTLRLIVQLEQDHVRLYGAFWKIAANGNVADNYWRPGNLMARLDPRSGRVEECMTGLGPDYRVVETAPDTGQALRGFVVPHYAEALDLVMKSAPAFVGLKIQAWDIAITFDGAVALEINAVGSVFLPQLANGRGMDDPDFRAYITRASKGFSPWARS